MAHYIEANLIDPEKPGKLKASLDNPECGYHDNGDIFINGWVLPEDPLKNNIKVIIRINEGQNHKDYETISVSRPDVFKALLPDILLPEEVMQVGFSIRIPFIKNIKATVIIVKEGQELPWYNLNIFSDGDIIHFIQNIKSPTKKPINTIDLTSIIPFIKTYFPHTFHQCNSAITRSHVKSLQTAVSNDEFIIALYNSDNGYVNCHQSKISFTIHNSKTHGGNVFLFCTNKSGMRFIIHQHVTSIDGIYYPEKGVYFSFCHGSECKIPVIINIILNGSNHFQPGLINSTGFLVGHGRPYHFMYDGMLGLETIYQHTKKIEEDVQFYTLNECSFIDAPKIYNSRQSAKFVAPEYLNHIEKKGTLIIKIGALFGNGAKEKIVVEKIQNLDKKIHTYVKDIRIYDDIHGLKKHFPIIWIGITAQKRAWLEQVDGYANIINRLYESFPGMAVIFDGWTSTLVPLQRDKVETESDNVIIEEIKKQIPSDIATINLIGSTIDKKIRIGSFVDCAVVNYATGSINISRFCGRPCVTHISNSFRPLRYEHIHKNALHIAEKYITDVNDGELRPDSTSYHIEWEKIYDALLLHLGQQKIIEKRW